MGGPSRLGVDDRGRVHYAARVPSLAGWPHAIDLASPYFVCLVVADGTTETAADVGEWARRVLAQGLVYACAWGPGCEVVHDVIDWEFLTMPDHANRAIVMTTWHEAESLEEAVDFFLVSAVPDEAYRSHCSAWLLIEVGDAGAASGARDLVVAKALTSGR